MSSVLPRQHNLGKTQRHINFRRGIVSSIFTILLLGSILEWQAIELSYLAEDNEHFQSGTQVAATTLDSILVKTPICGYEHTRW
jgi:hypothetical protein